MTRPVTRQSALTDLIDRIARLHLAARRDTALNPAQAAALTYLARANRFSRMPSAVAEYLAATRGTVSQTLKSLARKGLVSEGPAPHDRRARRYDLTPEGREAAARLAATADPALPPDAAAAAEAALRTLLAGMLRANGGRSFGLCHSCRHHRQRGGAPYCALLDLALTPDEAGQICVEHEAA